MCFPPTKPNWPIRIEFFGDEIDAMSEIDPLRGAVNRKIRRTAIYPGSHYATTSDTLQVAIRGIQFELEERLKEFRAEGNLLAAQRLEQRTNYDIEMHP